MIIFHCSKLFWPNVFNKKKEKMLQNVKINFLDDSGILISANSVSPEPVSIEEQFRSQLLNSLDKSSFFMNDNGHDNVSFYFFQFEPFWWYPFFELTALTNFFIFMCHFEAFIQGFFWNSLGQKETIKKICAKSGGNGWLKKSSFENKNLNFCPIFQSFFFFASF